MADENFSERRQLLQPNISYGHYAEPSAPAIIGATSVESAESVLATVPPLEANELPPPPYSAASGGFTPLVTCRVCKLSIDISEKTDQYVVKCNNCHEATPIKNAPPGKKYVRCPCNGLLICKSFSQRILCPRPNCKRIIDLAPSFVSPVVCNIPGTCQMMCAYCHNITVINIIETRISRCSHCRKKLTVTSGFAKTRGWIFLIVGIILLIIGIILVVLTISRGIEQFYYLYFIFFLIGISMLIRSIYFFTLKSFAIVPLS